MTAGPQRLGHGDSWKQMAAGATAGNQDVEGFRHAREKE